MYILYTDRISLCHGPISQTSVEQVLKKFNVEEGHFLVRESRSIDNAYTLSVCHNKKVMHYRIVHHKDGTYSFRDPETNRHQDITKGDVYSICMFENIHAHEYERFPTLYDLLKSYHQKAVRFEHIQWSPSVTDTTGTKYLSFIARCPLLRG